MMNARTLLRPSFFLALVVICLGGTTSLAGSLQVSTVTLDVAAPGAAKRRACEYKLANDGRDTRAL